MKLSHKLLAEFIGTMLLLAIITGSGIMGANMSQGNDAVALLGNSIATGCGLYVLISLIGSISGAHFNPVVTIMFWRCGTVPKNHVSPYITMQILGAICGVWLTHMIFSIELIQSATNDRSGLSLIMSELVSTLILLSVIKLGLKNSSEKVPMLVALTVTAGYWFTSSTFFANPAVTIARSFTDTFVGIAPADVAGFVLAQLIAVILIILISKKETA